MTTPASPAELQRRYRERLRNGRRIVPVEIDSATIEMALVARRFLRREDSDDPKAVAAALQAAVAALIVVPDEPR